MENRTLKELYTILLENGVNNSICFRIEDLVFHDKITFLEATILHKHFINQQPTIFSKFFWNKNYKKLSFTNDFWWKKNQRRK